ncbi:MAG: signal peptide peptidase SppA [Flavobacteriales bacterium]|nr:signal peptide peptidase SppA [Flavobacteriales bacterium]MCB9165938.1 signal peptide peptidase SppA [Flavobacteriales bacterium]
MRQFLKFMLASMLGTLLIGALLLIIFFATIAAIGTAFSLDRKPTKVKDDSVLLVKLDRPIVDRGRSDQFNLDFGPFKDMSRLGLDQVLKNIDKAERDDHIKGLFLDLSSIDMRTATLEEIRDKILAFRKNSGKPVIAYSEFYSQGTYLLATAADEIYVAPQGDLDFRGLRTNMMFLKGMFDKLDIDVEFIKGSNNRYKSFGETFTEDRMTPANREQMHALVFGIWEHYLDLVAAQRRIDRVQLNSIAEKLQVRHAQDAVDLGLADGVMYRDQVLERVKERMGLDPEKEMKSVELAAYTRAPVGGDDKVGGKAKLAVVFAQGSISSGESEDDVIGSTTLVEALSKARTDTSVKAIVLRVNSPGGSGLASDMIWREVDLARQSKPVVVSMGDLAASGGYYISCAADRIYAEPTTITGSIGVFGMIPNFKGFFNNKLGITFDGLKTNEYADLFDVSRPMRPNEREVIQRYVDDFYATFKQRVAEGRHLDLAMVDSIGRGRVWTGMDAQKIGLVDSIGGLESAIAGAAGLAHLDKYRIVKYPEQKELFEQILSELNTEAKSWVAAQVFGTDAELLDRFRQMREAKRTIGIQARMPFDIVID